MFVAEEKIDVTQISLTGTRALALIGILTATPQTFEEIKTQLIRYGLFEKGNSDDILRIDINTIKSMGCEISRPCISNNYKYIMQNHPFSLVLTKDDVKLFKRAYNKIKNNLSLENLIKYDDLFRKIANYIYDNEIKEMLLGISILKYYDVKELKELISDCESQKIIELIYRNSETKKEILKNIKAQKLVFQNDKIYLYGFDYEIQKTTVLLYKRIKKLISKKYDDNKIKPKNVLVTYQLQNIDTDLLSEDEKIIEQKDDKYIVEASFYNNFFAVQKVLSYGPKCIVLSPNEIKTLVINKLKEMREVYNG